jgi:CxxC motif-containing protein (DUF1111 family)
MVSDPVHGGKSVGKFGWKAQVLNLNTFAGDAYLNEMGITNPLFPDESCPQGDCSLLSANPFPGINDTGSGVLAFTDFMTLAPPPRGPINGDVVAGELVALRLGWLQLSRAGAGHGQQQPRCCSSKQTICAVL